MIAFFVFGGTSIVGSIIMFFINQPVSENNTTEFTAEISGITLIPIYRIKTVEHNAEFLIFWKETVLDMDALNNLTVGQTITFRIKNSDRNRLTNSNETIDFVALRVGGTNIITLDSYNEHIRKMRFQTTLGFAVAGIILLSLAVLCLLWYKEKLGKRKHT